MKRTSANFDAIQENHSPVLTVFPTELRQKMKGFGGTFTDAAVWNIDNLPERARKHLLESYFGVDGIEYSFGRVPIGSNDFSTRPYSYNDWSGDVNLSNFSLADEDLEHRIPILREALSLRNGSLKLLATPWTAPFWMKSNGRAQGAGVLLHEVDRIDMWKVYALYLLRYFEEFAKRGIHFYAVSAQNEPNLSRSAHFPWQAMYFSPQMLSEFVSKYLGPAIKSNKITKDLHIFPLEISREQLELYSQEICGNEKAFNYSSGIGIHWYADTKIGTNILRNVVTEWATKYVLYTESANGWLTNDVLLGDWNRAEKYVESMMETVNNGVTGWIDYNLCVDTSGGPSWIGNNLDAAIVVDKHNKSFMKQPMFYAIGHFSKFIGENADYMASEFSRKGIGVSDISHSAFVNPDGSRALILYNKNSSYSWNISVVDDATPFSQLILTLPPKSIVTVLWNKITFTSKLKEPQKDLQSQPFGESEIT
ncbi:unnamed protein product, partial [Mesorhabditis belari]|uniref:Glucosylceramidase n=1 Tax=Mesorhabditis belari TaxID=2138241 RepID=A0AAF3E7W5_9BILA